MHFLQTLWTLTNILIQCIQQVVFKSLTSSSAHTLTALKKGGDPPPALTARPVGTLSHTQEIGAPNILSTNPLLPDSGR